MQAMSGILFATQQQRRKDRVQISSLTVWISLNVGESTAANHIDESLRKTRLTKAGMSQHPCAGYQFGVLQLSESTDEA